MPTSLNFDYNVYNYTALHDTYTHVNYTYSYLQSCKSKRSADFIIQAINKILFDQVLHHVNHIQIWHQTMTLL